MDSNLDIEEQPQLASLPTDCLASIARNLVEARDLASFGLSSKELRRGLESDFVWEDAYRARFYPWDAARAITAQDEGNKVAPTPSGSTPRFASLYKERHKIDSAWRRASFIEDFGAMSSTGWINAVRALPSGAVVTGGADHSLKVYGADGASVMALDFHDQPIWTVDGDSQAVLSAGFGARVFRVCPETGALLGVFPCPSGVPGQAFCPFRSLATSVAIHPTNPDVFVTGYSRGLALVRDVRAPDAAPIACLTLRTDGNESGAAPRGGVFGARFVGASGHHLLVSGDSPFALFDLRRAGGPTSGAQHHVPYHHGHVGGGSSVSYSMCPLLQLAPHLSLADKKMHERRVVEPAEAGQAPPPFHFSLDASDFRAVTGSDMGVVSVWDVGGLAAGRYTFLGLNVKDSDPGEFLMCSEIANVTTHWLAGSGSTVFTVRLTDDWRVACASEEGSVALMEFGRAKADPFSGLEPAGPSTTGALERPDSPAGFWSKEELWAALRRGPEGQYKLEKYAKLWPQASASTVVRSFVQTAYHPSFRALERLEPAAPPGGAGGAAPWIGEEDPDDPNAWANIVGGASSRAPHSVDFGPQYRRLVFAGRTAVLHDLSAG